MVSPFPGVLLGNDAIYNKILRLRFAALRMTNYVILRSASDEEAFPRISFINFRDFTDSA